MDFISKNISVKFSLILFIIAIALAATGFYLTENYIVMILIAALAISAVLIHFIILKLPLSKIFNEMKALLTGHQYKKIFTDRLDEVGVLAHFFNVVTKNIERISTNVEEGKRMSKELSVGSDIQRKILPTIMPKISGLAVFGNTRPASEVGGDSFDIITAGDNNFIYVGDVTGHGLPAGLIMVMVNTLIRTFSETHPSGYDVIVNTNRILKQRIEPRRFMTCVLLRWNSKEKRMYYTGAGHEHIMIFHKKDGQCEIKQTGGIALGMMPDVSRIVREEEISLEVGDCVVLYSDGIVEAKNLAGEMFGMQRLKRSLEQYASEYQPDEIFSRISKDFGDFVGESIQQDDITLIAVQRA